MRLKTLFKSLRSRGIIGSADRMLSALQERFFDFRYGTDTVAFVELKSLTIAGEHLADGVAYEPTRMRLVRRAISALNLAPGGAFVDFGCGKGRVLLLAADYGFRRVTGVEFAKELCDTARTNLARYRTKTGIDTDIRIVEGDAVEYEVKDDESVFFLANPFSAALVEMVVKNIMHSLTAGKRRGFIIYNNPLWSDVVERQGFTPFLDFDGGECIVYSNTASR
jgi:SAM-dependent methyltransferase